MASRHHTQDLTRTRNRFGMKPKEITEWLLLFSIASCIVNCEYYSHEECDITGPATPTEIPDSIQKYFGEGKSQNLLCKPLSRRFLSKSTRENDFSRNRHSYYARSRNAENNLRNGRRQSVQLKRHKGKEISHELNVISFPRSAESTRHAGNYESRSAGRSYHKLTEVRPERNTRKRKIARKIETITPESQSNARENIHSTENKILNLKEDNIMPIEKRRYNGKDSYKKQGGKRTLFKVNRISNKENRQEQQNDIGLENFGTVSKERLTVGERTNKKIISKNVEKTSAKNKLFISNPSNEISRALRIRSRVDERNFNRLENERFRGLGTWNRKNIITMTEIRSKEEKRQDIKPQGRASTCFRRSLISEVPVINDNILQRSVIRAQTSLVNREVHKSSKSRQIENRTTREELTNRRYRSRNDRILRANLRTYASRVPEFQTFSKTDRTSEESARRISTPLPPESTEGKNLYYASYSRLSPIKIMSTLNRNSKLSAVDRKENRLPSRETNGRMHRSKINIRSVSDENVAVQVSTKKGDIHRFGINRKAELQNTYAGKRNIFSSGVAERISRKINAKELSETSDRKIAETRKYRERSVAGSAKRTIAEKRNDLSKRRSTGRLSIISGNTFPAQFLRTEGNSRDQRSYIFSKRRILMYSEKEQRRRERVTAATKIRGVGNFGRRVIFRINAEDNEIFHYSEEKKLITGQSQKLESCLRRPSFSDAMLIGMNVRTPKLREDYIRSARYRERSINNDMNERMRVSVRSGRLSIKNNGRLSTQQNAFQNTGDINPDKISRNVPSSTRNVERMLLNLHIQRRMRTTERNGRGFRGKLNILRRYSGERLMKSFKDNEYFSRIIEQFRNRLSGEPGRNRIHSAERNIRDYRAENYKFENLSPADKEMRGLTNRATRRIRINVSNNVKIAEKRIPGGEIRERRVSSERSGRVLGDLSRHSESHDELKRVNFKIHGRLIPTGRSGVVHNVRKQNSSPMAPRNGRGFRGKYTNFVRHERILKYSYNPNKFYLTVFNPEQDISLKAKVLKPFVNSVRFIAFRKPFSNDQSTGRLRNYRRASYENQRNIRNNERALLEYTGKINSNMNMLAVEQTPIRNIHSRERTLQERALPYNPHFNSNRRSSDEILSLNPSASRRLERYLEARIGNRKTRDSRISEESQLSNTRQRVSHYRISEDTNLPEHGALGSTYISKDIILENRPISSAQIHSSQESHFIANEKWNTRNVFSLIAHVLLGLSIVMAASDNDPFKCRSFKERLFDALTLRTDVF